MSCAVLDPVSRVCVVRYAIFMERRAPWDSAPYLEVRKYDPYLVAKVTLEEPDMKKALSTGFKKVTP